MLPHIDRNRPDLAQLWTMAGLSQLGLLLAVVVSLLPLLSRTAHADDGAAEGIYVATRLMQPDLQTLKPPTNAVLRITYHFYEEDLQGASLSSQLDAILALLEKPRLRLVPGPAQDVDLEVTTDIEYIEGIPGSERAFITVMFWPRTPLVAHSRYELWEHIQFDSSYNIAGTLSGEYHLSRTFRTAAAVDDGAPQFAADEDIEIALVYEPVYGADGVVSITERVIHVSWPPAVDEALFSYHVYRNGDHIETRTTGEPRLISDTINACGNASTGGESISYRVEAVDIAGNHSALSAETMIGCPAEHALAEGEAELTLVDNAHRIVGARNPGDPGDIYSDGKDVRRVRASRDGCRISGERGPGWGIALVLLCWVVIGRPRGRSVLAGSLAFWAMLVAIAGCGDNQRVSQPEGMIVFPPLDGAISYGDSVLVRGTVRSDDPIAVIRVNGIAASVLSRGRVLEWQARVPLTHGDNQLKVSAETSGDGPSYEFAARHIEAVLAPALLESHWPLVVDQARGYAYLLLEASADGNAATVGPVHTQLIRVDLATGISQVVEQVRLSSFRVGDLFYDPASARLLLLLESSRSESLQLYWFDTERGTLSEGPKLSENLARYNRSLLADFAGERFIYSSQSGILAIDFATGLQSIVARYADDIAYRADFAPLIAMDDVTGEIYFGDTRTDRLLSLDPRSGTWAVRSDGRLHAGPSIRQSKHVKLRIDGKRRRAVFHLGEKRPEPRVTVIDLDSGDRDYLDTGFSHLTRAMTVDAGSGRVWLADKSLGVFWHEGDDGAFTTLAVGDFREEHGLYGSDSMAWDRHSNTAFLGRSLDNALFAVHLGSAVDTARVDVGPQYRPRILSLSAQAIGDEGQTLWLQDLQRRMIFAADTGTHERYALTGSHVGQGPLFGEMGSMVYDARGQRLLILDERAERLVAVDTTTGNRSLVVALPDELTFRDTTILSISSPQALYLDERDYHAVISYPYQNLLLFVDLQTGAHSALRNVVPYRFDRPDRGTDYGEGPPPVVRRAASSADSAASTEDADDTRLLVVAEFGLFAIDKRTGVRELISGCDPIAETCVGQGPALKSASALELVNLQGHEAPLALVWDSYWHALLAIDFATGERIAVAR